MDLLTKESMALAEQVEEHPVRNFGIAETSLHAPQDLSAKWSRIGMVRRTGAYDRGMS